MRFTTEQAFYAHRSGHPILINNLVASEIILSHGIDSSEYFAEYAYDARRSGHDAPGDIYPALVDAWLVFKWLGY